MEAVTVMEASNKREDGTRLMEDKELIREAYKAQKYSYSPYSGFQVGAALLGKSGCVYTGCNIENAAYSPTNCAERTAFFKAVSVGEREFEKIVIVGNKEGGLDEERDYCAPCGVCRQVMAEFCNPKEFMVLLAKSETDYRTYRLEELFPLSFSKDNL
ncbi:MAG: hypothetical protein RHS_5477 [Robinsoniella sp. RHS]|nr:MAG: hypothetical protein RHS_5477 [Robinsoniella sp. RHS]